MGRLVYSGIASLDGCTVDAEGRFDWAAPDAEVHAFVNDLERSVGTYLYGRRMWEVLRYWETAPTTADADTHEVAADYARIWQAADKVVHSTTLGELESPHTRLETSFDPAAVRALVDASERDVSIGGPTLAAEALRAKIVDDVHLLLHPVAVGGGTRFFPDGLRVDLDLVEQRRFAGGVVYLRYTVRR